MYWHRSLAPDPLAYKMNISNNLNSITLLFLAISLGLAAPTILRAQTISTVAGNGTQDSSGDNGSPASASLGLPSGVWGDTSGVIYIADTGNNKIRRINAARDSITTYAGTGTAGFSGDGAAATSAKLNTPAGIFVDSAGVVYITDTGNNRVRQISTAGIITTIAGKDTAGFSGDGASATSAKLNGPTAVYARGGNVYIADTGNNRIRRITSGTINTIAGLDTTAGIFIDDTTATAATLNGPTGVFVDTAGNVYIADTNNHRIRKIAAADSTISTVAGTGSPGFAGDGDLPINARLSFPAAVVGDSLGVLYISDRFNHRIRRINLGSNITTIAGKDSVGFSGDGAAANIAKLASPAGLFLTRADTLYIADANNHRIRKIVPDDTRGFTRIDTVGPGGEIQLLSVALTGDGSTSINSLSFTLTDLTTATGLTVSDLVEFRLWESTDDSLSSNDSQIGTLDAALVTLGSQATVQATSLPRPAYGSVRYYLLSVTIASTATQGQSIRVATQAGALATTTGGRGSRVVANDSLRATIDVIAQKLVFTRKPAGTFSGTALNTQPIVSAVDENGLVDLDFTDTVSVSTNGSGTLLHNRVIAIDGVATFTNLTYSTATDDEQILLFANDEVGGAGGDLDSLASDTLTINVINDPPIVDFPALVLKEDDPIGFRTRYSQIVSDPDDTTWTFTFQSSHILASVSATNDSIIVVPEANWFGIDTLTVTATDAFGASHSDQGIIEVTAVNDAPQLLLADSLVFAEDDTLTLNLQEQVSDVDDAFANLNWSITPSPGLSTTYDNASGQLQLWTAADSSGSFTLQFQVKDPKDLTVKDTLKVTVSPVNDLPTFLLFDASILQGETLALDLAATTADKDHALVAMTWTAAADSLIAVEISGSQALLTPRADFSGSRDLTFTATDPDGGAASDGFRLTVLRVNQPPTIDALPDTAAAPGDTLVIDLSSFASDPDDPAETLIWIASAGSRIGASLIGQSLTLVLPAGTDSYVDSVAVGVFDLFGAAAQDTFSIAVEAILPPVVSIPDIEFEAGRIVELTLARYIEGEIATLTAVADSNLQVIIESDTQLATISTIHQWKGVAQIAFTATSDRGLTAADTAVVTVTNPHPVVSGLPELFLDAGLSTQLALRDFARDDEDIALLTWSALPDPGLQVSIHSVLHVATISASETLATGPVRIVLKATDAQGASAVDTLLINIHGIAQTDTTDYNRPPTIAPIPAVSFHSGNTATLALDRYAEDDGSLSSLRWKAIPDDRAVVSVVIDSSRIAAISALVDVGEGAIFFHVEDPEGLSAQAEVAVEVLPEVTDPESGDFDGDGHIGFADFFRFVDAVGLTPFHPGWDPAFDLNEDRQVSLDDFFLFADAFAASNAAQ